MALLFGAAAASAADSGTGTIEGRVYNPANGEYLETVRITVEGTAQETFTDSGGRYRLNAVPAGTARVKAFFTGLVPQTLPVVVAAGQVSQQDFNLAPPGATVASDGTVKMDQFVVITSKEMDGAAIAINEQRFAANIKNVVSTDEFGHVAEGNIGEFMKYLPGVTIEYGGGYARGISLNGVPSAYVPITVDGFNLASTGGDNNTGRSAQVDMASINNIARIEVSFSPTPESQGSALAGTVNLIPRSAFERSKPSFSSTVSMVMRDNARDFNYTPGPRERPTRKVHPSVDFSYIVPVNDRFGFTLTGGFARQYTAEDFIQSAWRGAFAPTNGNAFPNTTTDQPYLSTLLVRDAPKDTVRRAFGFTADYKLTRTDKLSFSFQYFTFNADTTARALTFNVNRVNPGDFSTSFSHGAAGAGDILLNAGGRDRINRTYMPTLIWRHDGPEWRLEAGVGHSQGTNRIRDIDKGFFNNSMSRRTGLTVSFDDIYYLRPGRITVTDAAGAAVDPYNDSMDLQRSAYGNVRRDFSWSVPFTLKGGLDVRQRVRDLRGGMRPYNFVGADGRASTTPVGNDDSPLPYLDPSFSERFMPFGFPRAQWVSNERLWALYRANPNTYTTNADTWYRSEVTLSKHAEETIYAGFLRGDMQLLNNRLKLTGGVRAEQTNVKAEGPLTDPTGNFQRNASGAVILGANGQPLLVVPASDTLGVSRRTLIDRGFHADKEYLRLFPSLNASYNIRENLIARAAVYTSVGRPDFEQYAGGITLPNTENAPSNTNRIVVNNAGIKVWDARTLKVRLEYYFEGVGQVSIGAFRREFKNFFGATVFSPSDDFLALYNLDPGTYGGYDVSTQYNLPGKVRMEGYEIDYKQALTFLPRWARGVQVFANGSSQRALGDENGDFAGFVPKSGNLGISLTRPKYNLRVNWNFTSRQRVNAIAPGLSIDPGTFTWTSERLYMDVSGEYNLTKHFTLFANLRNLTGVFDDTQVEGPNTPEVAQLRQRFDLGSLWTFGVKARF
ncbi:MAG: TonB-dependent receptor [Verrucomicrobiota bacterium]